MYINVSPSTKPLSFLPCVFSSVLSDILRCSTKPSNNLNGTIRFLFEEGEGQARRSVKTEDYIFISSLELKDASPGVYIVPNTLKNFQVSMLSF